MAARAAATTRHIRPTVPSNDFPDRERRGLPRGPNRARQPSNTAVTAANGHSSTGSGGSWLRDGAGGGGAGAGCGDGGNSALSDGRGGNGSLAAPASTRHDVGSGGSS